MDTVMLRIPLSIHHSGMIDLSALSVQKLQSSHRVWWNVALSFADRILDRLNVATTVSSGNVLTIKNIGLEPHKYKIAGES